MRIFERVSNGLKTSINGQKGFKQHHLNVKKMPHHFEDVGSEVFHTLTSGDCTKVCQRNSVGTFEQVFWKFRIQILYTLLIKVIIMDLICWLQSIYLIKWINEWVSKIWTSLTVWKKDRVYIIYQESKLLSTAVCFTELVQP